MGGFSFKNTGGFWEFILAAILIIFLFVNNIVLMNLLIAILSNTFSKMSERSSMEYSNILYDSYKKNKFDKNFGVFVLFPPPFCAINFLILPFMFFKNIRKKLNNCALNGSKNINLE